MTDSIFKKMLLFALFFSLGSLLCISLLIGFLLEKQIYDRTKETLLSNALELNNEVEQFLDGSLTSDQIRETLLSLRERENIQVSIMTSERKSLFEEENPDVQNWIKGVLAQSSSSAEITFHINEEMNMFFIGVPIVVKNEHKGAIFLYTPMEEAEALIKDINKIIGLSFLLLLLPIVLGSWFLSRKLTSPIVLMSETVRSISKGHFENQLQLKGNDELVTLGMAINSMADRLADIEQNRKRFIGEISHELRTPLTTIRSTLQGITDDIFTDEEREELISLSINEIKRISQLIDDLTELSALEEKAVVLYRKNVSLTTLIEDCILQLNLQAKEKDIHMVANLQPGIVAHVDRYRMKQVYINLMDNAIKHSYPGSAIKVSLSKKHDRFVMMVENQGEHIPDEVLPYLFDRFYKTDPSRSQKGHGLGLTIAKKIVELHDGEISVTSKDGIICFIVDIPITGYEINHNLVKNSQENANG
jgi:signal transduction histidine kinase